MKDGATFAEETTCDNATVLLQRQRSLLLLMSREMMPLLVLS